MATTVFTVGGTAIPVPSEVILGKLVPYQRGSYPTLAFFARTGPLAGLPDPYLGKTATLAIDGVTYFTGDVISGPDCQFDNQLGWVRSYQCAGLQNRLNWFPHTDSNTGTATSQFNLQPEDPSYIAARAGRTIGQILAACLTMTANATAASGYGVGHYASLSPPTLSAVTLADLAQLLVIPAVPIYFDGDSLNTAIEALISTWAVNYFFYIDPATFDYRFVDMRLFAAHTFTLNSDLIEPTPLARNVAPASSRVVVRGGPLTYGVMLTQSGGGLAQDFAHDGLTNPSTNTGTAITNWVPSDFQTPTLPPGQATAGPITLSGSSVTAPAITSGGYNYPASSSSIGVLFTGGTGSGAVAHATSNAAGVVISITVTAGGSYTAAPTAVIAAPTGSNADTGTCICPSTTQVTVTSANKGMQWPANFWDQTVTGRHGVIYLAYSLGAGISQFTTRRIVANTALTAGGSSTLTLDLPLAITAYDSYEIVGFSGGASVVWRLYRIVNPAIGAALANQFSYPQPFRLAAGNAALMTSFPMGSVVASSGNEVSAWFTSDPASGTILFQQPTYVIAGNSIPADVRALVGVNQGPNVARWPPDALATPTLNAGAITTPVTINLAGSGFGTTTPQIYILGDGSGATATVTISGGALTAVAVTNGGINYTWAAIAVLDPTGSAAPQHAGTSHTVEGLSHTLTVTLTAWRDPGNFQSMLYYARELHQSVCDTVVEGSIRYIDLYKPALVPGIAANITGNTYTTGWENPLTSLGTGGLPVTSVMLEWPQTESPNYVTTLHCTSRRAANTAAAYLRPDRTGMSILGGYAGAGGLLASGQAVPGVTNLGAGITGQLEQSVSARSSGRLSSDWGAGSQLVPPAPPSADNGESYG